MLARITCPYEPIRANLLDSPMPLIFHVCRIIMIVGLSGLPTLCATNAQTNPVAKKRSCERIEREFAVARKPIAGRKLDEFLFEAARHGCGSLIDEYLSRGASVKSRDRFGNTALSVAARTGHRSTADLLIRRGSKVNHKNLLGSSVLLRAATQRRRSVVRLLLKKGADPNAVNRRGVSPLIAAAFNGDRRLVKALLAAGADPDHQDSTGKGAIVYAAARGFKDMVELFLGAGLDPDKIYGNDLTALMWAAGHSNDVPESEGLETVQFLLTKLTNIDAQDNRGRTALMIAAERGHTKIVTVLLAAGANRSLRDRQGNTALQLAANDVIRSVLEP